MKICLSIGANLGRRAATLREAARRLARLPGTRLLGVSSFYETAPWGKTDQPSFLNGAAVLETRLAPEEFLCETQAIEQALGRVRHEHWGARTIDIDLVWAEEDEEVVRCDTPKLRLPHPYLLSRAFVLEPLRELCPRLTLEGTPIADWCEKNGAQDVRKTDELADPYPLQMIACVSQNRGIGNKGKLLFQIPEDLAYFKQQTKTPGSVVILGRKTWESLPQPLAGRTHIILSSSLSPVGIFLVAAHIEELSQTIERLWNEHPHRPFWVIGGGEVYQGLLPYARRILLTEVAETLSADTFFPATPDFHCTKKRLAKTPGVTFCEYLRMQ